MLGAGLTRLIALLTAAAVGLPLAGASGPAVCGPGCGEGAAVETEAAFGEGTVESGGEACCSCHDEGGEHDGRRGQDEEKNDDCRDCGCPECAVHMAVVGIVWAGEGTVPAVRACGLGLAWPGTSPARGDVEGLIRPPRMIAA